MRCELVRAAISERMDGERLAPAVAVAVDDHMSTCGSCRAYAHDARRVRASVRLRVAEPVPDLVEPIMAAVRAESNAAGRATATTPDAVPAHAVPEHAVPTHALSRAGGHAVRARRHHLRRLTPFAAALLVGLVVGSLLVGGPWAGRERPAGDVALAERVLAGARRVDVVRADFTLVERNFADEVPERRFDLRLAFEAPERFRLDITDRTRTYPDASWIRNDVSYVVNRSRSALEAPSACPPGVRACPRTTVLVRDRPPFSSATPLPLDLVLPVNVFAGAGARRLVAEPGDAQVLGRPAVHVVLPFERAAPLFSFMGIGGRWRPFYPRDRVDLWLDEATWFPLRAKITATPGDERFAWEQRFGLPHERAGRPLLRLDATRVVEQTPPRRVFRVSGTGAPISEGARPVASNGLDPVAGRLTRLAVDAAGMNLYRTTTAGKGDGREIVASSVRGLQWMTIGFARSWDGPGPVGVGPAAQPTRLPGGSLVYVDDTSDVDRRVSIHTSGLDVALSSNLPRDRLLEVAAALDLKGRAVPEGWNRAIRPDAGEG